MTWADVGKALLPALSLALLGLVKLALSEKVLGKVVLIILRHLAAKTTNNIDDEIVAAVEAALN